MSAPKLPLPGVLNFPAAILQPPVFDPNADAAAHYGAIDAIMAHKINDNSDNLGAEFDAQGTLDNGRTAEDLAWLAPAGR